MHLLAALNALILLTSPVNTGAEIDTVDFRVQVYPYGGYYSYPPYCPPGYGYGGRGGFSYYYGPGYGYPGCYRYGGQNYYYGPRFYYKQKRHHGGHRGGHHRKH